MGPLDGAVEKRRKETWLDWIASVPRTVALANAQPLLSKEDLLSKLAEAGINASARDLVYWQKRGVIPFPTKRRVNSATYSTYPSWMLVLIKMLRQLQEDGETLEVIARDLRAIAVTGAGFDPDAESVRIQRGENAHRELSRRCELVLRSLTTHAARYSEITGDRITSVEVVFHHAPPCEKGE